MNKRRNSIVLSFSSGKKGQFYLIAALVIVVGLIAVVGVKNYSSVRQTDELTSLVEDLEIEAENVLKVAASDQGDFANDLEDFAEDFENLEDDYNYLFFYGDEETINNKNKMTVYYVKKVEGGDIILQSGGGDISWTAKSTDVQIEEVGIDSITQDSNFVTVTLEDGTSYNIEVTSGQNFYLIVRSPLSE